MERRIGIYAGKFNIVHIGHVRSMLKAYSKVDELHIFVHYDEEFEKQRYKKHKLEYIPAFKRVRWWTQITKNMDNIHVHAVYHKNTMDHTDWENGGKEMLRIVGNFTDMFYAEKDYTEYFERLYPEVKLHLLEKEIDISATKILENGIYRYWEYLPKEVRADFVKTVTILGAESSGKSVLSKKLAKYFNTEYIEEYGRTLWDKYNGKIGKVFEYEDYKILTYYQKIQEYEKCKKANKILIVDTETIVTQTWLKFYEGKESGVLSEISKEEDYKLYILLKPENKFVQDGTRNFEDERFEIYMDMKKKLLKYRKPYVEISGNINNMFKRAVKEIEKIN